MRSVPDLAGSVVVLNVVNSVDTPVGDLQTRRVDGLFPGAHVLAVSMDLPFALARWTSSAGTARSSSSDPGGRVAHVQYVADQDAEPDYDAAVVAVSRLGG